MVRALLDTNALAEAARRRPSATFMKRLRANEATVAISSVTLHEALFGVERLPSGRRKTALREYMRAVVTATPVLSYTAKAAEWHACERARLERTGRRLPYADGQIAAIAVVNGLTLVTANARDFHGIVDLRVEDWWA
jgi:tRNA(fMet)-specific endonuclease VapC